ncbi:MAG: hypothetical protein EBT42_06435 [Actinobacteria bacterium]|nr:hypothetical protein [Actinomycetota bacterium]
MWSAGIAADATASDPKLPIASVCTKFSKLAKFWTPGSWPQLRVRLPLVLPLAQALALPLAQALGLPLARPLGLPLAHSACAMLLVAVASSDRGFFTTNPKKHPITPDYWSLEATVVFLPQRP